MQSRIRSRLGLWAILAIVVVALAAAGGASLASGDSSAESSSRTHPFPAAGGSAGPRPCARRAEQRRPRPASRRPPESEVASRGYRDRDVCDGRRLEPQPQCRELRVHARRPDESRAGGSDHGRRSSTRCPGRSSRPSQEALASTRTRTARSCHTTGPTVYRCRRPPEHGVVQGARRRPDPGRRRRAPPANP